MSRYESIRSFRLAWPATRRSCTLLGEITVKNGAVQQHNFDDYPVLRIHQTPKISVHLMASPEEPTGAGEPPTPAVAPALANAIVAAGGPRIRELPMWKKVVADPEVTAATVRAVVDYVRMLAPPAPGEDTPQRQRGSALFTQVGCDACHVRQFQTGPSTIAALANQQAVLYSDLLLHDMGDELADNRPDGDANGREWKTPPLWGLRVARDFLNGDLFLLHDGRAVTIAEAIGLHGGEAASSRSAFQALSADDSDALLEFVRSR